MFACMGYEIKLSEEIIRFAFEVAIMRERTNRFIAFSNPTAGPWKLVLGRRADETYELHRFGREDVRPDVIVVCDKLRKIVVIEAKETADQLDSGTIEKTYGISAMFADIFGLYDSHEDWLQRKTYEVITGFLFGSASAAAAALARSELEKRIELAGFALETAYICAAITSGKGLEFSEYSGTLLLN